MSYDPRKEPGYAESQLTADSNLLNYGKYPGFGDYRLTSTQYGYFLHQQAQRQVQYDRLLKGLVDRSADYPTSFVNDAPSTFAHLITTPMDSYAVKLIGRGLQSAYPWLKSVTGVDGNLAGAYASALSIQDPEQRAMALNFVQNLASDLGRGYAPGTALTDIGPGTQIRQYEADIATLRQSGATDADVAKYLASRSTLLESFASKGLSVGFSPDGSRITATVETQDTGFGADGKLQATLSPQAKDFQYAVALLQYLFPNLRPEDIQGFPTGNAKLFAAANIVTNGIGKGFDHIFKPVGDVLGAGLEQLGGPGHAVKHFGGAAVRRSQPVIGAYGDYVKAPLSLLVAAVSDVDYLARKIPNFGPPGEGNFINPLKVAAPWAFAGGHPLGLGFDPSQAGTGLGLSVNNFFGIKPSNPVFQRNLAVSQFIVSWAALKDVGEISAATKAAGVEPLSSLTGGRFFNPRSLAGEYRAGNVVAQAAFDFLSKPPAQFAETATGRNLFGDFVRVHNLHPDGLSAGDLLSQYPKMPPDMARALAEAGPTMAEKGAAYVNYMENKPPVNTGALLSEQKNIYQQLDAMNRPREAGTEFGFDLPMDNAHLLTRLVEIQKELDLGAERAPAFQYLKPSSFNRIAARLPKGPVENVLGAIYNPQVRFAPHLSRLFDTMGHTRLWNWFRDDAPPDAKARNAELIRTYGRRAGVPPEELNRILRQMTEVSNDAEFFAWLETFGKDGGFWDRAKFVYKDNVKEMKRWSSRSDEEAHRSMIQTTVTVDGIELAGSFDVLSRQMLDESGNVVGQRGLPSMDAELIDHPYLPSVERLIDSSSATRHYVNKLRQGGTGAKYLGNSIYGLKLLSSFSTALFKPLILTSRVPALILRTQLEQIARAEGFGFSLLNPFTLDVIEPAARRTFRPSGEGQAGMEGVRGTALSPAREALGRIPRLKLGSRFAEYLPADLRDLGLMFDPMTEVLERPGTRSFGQKQVYEVNPDGTRSLLPEGGQAIYWNAVKTLKSPTIQQLLRSESVESWVSWLEGDTRAARLARARFDPILKDDVFAKQHPEATMTELRTRWGERMNQSLDQLTNGRADLRNLLITGKWHLGGPSIDALLAEKIGPEMIVEYRGLLHNTEVTQEFYSNLRAELGANPTGAGREALKAARAEKVGAVDALNRLERRIGVKGARITFDIAHPEALIAQLAKEVENGHYIPPKTLGGYDFKNMSNTEAAVNARNLMQQWIYRRGFPVIGRIPGVGKLFQIETAAKVDALFTRGSVFYQASSDAFRVLKERGYSNAQARIFADAEGARLTADIMYDLSSRTSAQRFLRNQSYFLPAYQELLTTWLVKIPSRYYWPVGAFLYANRASLLVNLLKDTHIIRKDQNGQWIVPIPGLGEFLSKAGNVPIFHPLKTLDPQVVKDMISFRAQSINLVAQGWPSVSTQYTIPLNLLAKHSETIAALANAIEPFGTETTFMPSAVTYFWEAMTGNSPPWEFMSLGHQQQIHDLGFDDAVKQSIAELDGKGIKAPMPDKFADTPEGNAAFLAAQTKYRDQVMREAKNVFRGWGFVRLLGSTLGPAALHVTDSYKADAARVLSTLYGKEPTRDQFQTDEQFTTHHDDWLKLRADTINTYLADHPGSVAYLVGRSILTGKDATIPYTRTGEDAYWNSFQAGIRDVLRPEDYLTRIMAWESYRHYVGQRDQELFGVSGGDWRGLLTSGKARSDVLTSFQKQWQRYLYLQDQAGNPVSAMIASQQRRWAESNDPTAIPQTTFQTEWLSNAINAVNDVANSTAVGGIRDTDVKRTLSILKGQLADVLEGTTPSTPDGKNFAWYGQNVLTPYWDKVIPLYAQAKDIQARGGDPGPIYDQIRDISNRAGADAAKMKGPDGKVGVPSPEEVQWGKLSGDVQPDGSYDGEKAQQVLSWQTRPIVWLTDFQAKQAGWSLPSGWNEFAKRAAAIQAQTQAYIDSQSSFTGGTVTVVGGGNVATSSSAVGSSTSAADWALMQRDLAISQEAQKYSPEVGRLWGLSQGPAAGRIIYLNADGNNQAFRTQWATAQYIADQAKFAGVSPRGFAETGNIGGLKAGMFAQIDAMRDPTSPNYNKALDDLLTRIGHSMQYQGRDFLEGPLLYNSAMFGFLNTAFYPEYIIQAHLAAIGG